MTNNTRASAPLDPQPGHHTVAAEPAVRRGRGSWSVPLSVASLFRDRRVAVTETVRLAELISMAVATLATVGLVAGLVGMAAHGAAVFFRIAWVAVPFMVAAPITFMLIRVWTASTPVMELLDELFDVPIPGRAER